MPAALAITPASGSITAKNTVCRVDVTGGTVSDGTAFDSTKYPTEPAVLYYILFDDGVSGNADGRSYNFGVASDGTASFNGYTFPASGSYTVRLRKAADDSDAATLAVTVN